MANLNWIIERSGGGAGVVYTINQLTGRRFNCGTIEADVPDAGVVEWIYEEGRPVVGDKITLSDGRSFFYQAPRAVAQA